MAEYVADGVWLLDLGLVPPFATNSYLLDDGEVTLVDAGLPVNRPSLRDELAATGHAPEDLDRVLVTHYDVDHTGGLARLGREIPVYVGEADARLHHKGAFHHVARWLFPLPDDVEVRRVHDGDRIGGFEAFHTPGHNPGHTVYVHDDLAVCLLGDLVWGEPEGLSPPFWLDSYDMHELRESIRDLAARVPDFEYACMAHGDPVVEAGSDALRALADRLP
jgi:glyoxylase-like metal-dependent hydrolase (beta-lactamase superfamily II)